MSLKDVEKLHDHVMGGKHMGEDPQNLNTKHRINP